MATSLLSQALEELPSEECVVWPGRARTRHGYAVAAVERKATPAHRVVFEAVVGPIPEGLDLDHLCRNRPCVNPAHLEPVTRRTNLLRGDTLAARGLDETCARGHAFDEDNTYLEANKAGRYTIRRCRACARDNAAARRARRAS